MLTLCMIVKNEEANLDACLRSTGDLADYIIVVDNGSIDQTTEIAKKYGAHVVRSQYEGFSELRNLGLSYVVGGSWVLVLDADEQIDYLTRNLTKKITQFRPDCSIGYWFTRLTCAEEKDRADEVDHVVRLFYGNSVHFSGGVHETVNDSVSRLIWHPSDCLRIYHYPANRKEKSERYIQILEKEKSSLGRPTRRVLESLIVEYSNLCDKQKIIKALKEYTTVYDTAHENLRAAIHMFTKFEFGKEAKDFYQRAVELDPDDIEVQAYRHLFVRYDNNPR